MKVYFPTDICDINYSCSDHWICIMVVPKEGKTMVLDSLDVPEKSYAEFMNILQK